MSKKHPRRRKRKRNRLLPTPAADSPRVNSVLPPDQPITTASFIPSRFKAINALRGK